MLADQIFTSLGLNQKQIQICQVCLKCGVIRVQDIVNQTNLKRSTIVDQLKSLEKQGLIKKLLSPKNKKTFQLIEVEQLKNLIKQRMSQLDAALKAADQIKNITQQKIKVSYFEGRDGINRIMQEVLNCQSKLTLYISSFNQAVKLMGKAYWQSFLAKRIKQGVYSKALRTKRLADPRLDVYKSSSHQEVRYIDLDPDMNTGINIFDDKVAILSNDKNGFGVLIESQDVAQAMRGVFNKLWGMGRK